LNTTLWEVITTLESRIPFTKDNIEQLFHTRLEDTHNTGNTVYYFYKGGPIDLENGVSVSNIDLRIKKDGKRPSFISLNLSGTCISWEEVKLHYKNIKITGLPKGGSLDEEVSYSDFRPWGKLSFGFKERNPACLAGVAFNPAYILDLISSIEYNIAQTQPLLKQGYWLDADFYIKNGLGWASSGDSYTNPATLENAKRQLAYADQLQNSGQVEKAVLLRIEVLQQRLAEFKARH